MLKIFTDNAHYIVCLRNKRNALKIRALATQTKPCNASFVLNAYLDATKPKPTIRDNENPHRGICGKWELGEKTEGGWRSIIDVETGKYLTASSNKILSSQGMIFTIN